MHDYVLLTYEIHLLPILDLDRVIHVGWKETLSANQVFLSQSTCPDNDAAIGLAVRATGKDDSTIGNLGQKDGLQHQVVTCGLPCRLQRCNCFWLWGWLHGHIVFEVVWWHWFATL